MTKITLCGRKLALFGFDYVSAFGEGANPKCAKVGWLKLFFKMCGGKIFKTLRWLECRQSRVGMCRDTAKLSVDLGLSVVGRVVLYACR